MKVKKKTSNKKIVQKVVRDKAERWRELAMFRLGMVDKYCRDLEKLANKSNYEYNDVQVHKLTSTLRNIIDRVEETYRSGGKNPNKYTL
jgi:hypothetical protein